MRKILFALLLLPFVGSAQVKQLYNQYGGTWKRLEVKVGFRLPMNDSSTKDGGVASFDSAQVYYNPADSSVYYYTGFQWLKVGTGTGTNIYNSNGILTGARTLTGLNNTYSLNFDSLNSWRVQRNGITRFSMSSTTSSMIGANTNAAFTANATQAIVNYQGNALRIAVDSSTITKILSYETNINGSLTPNAHATKSYVDSLRGTITSTNFANANLTLTADRTHSGSDLYSATLDSMVFISNAHAGSSASRINNAGGSLTLSAENSGLVRGTSVTVGVTHLELDPRTSGTAGFLKLHNIPYNSDANLVGIFIDTTDDDKVYRKIVTGGGSGTNNANVGSGYRWLKPGTQEVKTFFGVGATLDSATNTDAITITPDVRLTNTATLTNKRWTARQDSTTSSATPTINTDNVDIYKLTALAADITSMTTNLSGTPNHGDILEIQITGTATRNLTFGSAFVSSTVILPTATNSTNTLTLIFQYYTNSSYGNFKWVLVNYY